MKKAGRRLIRNKIISNSESRTTNNAAISPIFKRIDAAAYLGVTPRTLADWACTGRYGLSQVKVRLSYYFKSDLDAFLQSRRV